MTKHSDFFASAIEEGKSNQDHLRHNFDLYRLIHGAYHVTKENFLEFDPRADYWHLPERVFLVGYFTEYWHARFLPAAALRKLAYLTFQHFDIARREGKLGPRPNSVDYREGKEWEKTIALLRKVAESAPDFKEYHELAAVFPKGLEGETLRDSLLFHLENTRNGENLWMDFPYYKRLAFFPFIDLKSLDELKNRQAFFMAFYTLFTSTNSYKVGGAQAFASVIQNNPTKLLFSFVERWMNGESLASTPMEVNRNEDRVNCQFYMPIVELYGFLTLSEAPFYNEAAAPTYIREFGNGELEERSQILELLRGIRNAEDDFIASNSDLMEGLSSQFDSLIKEPLKSTFNIVEMEGISSKRLAKEHPEQVAQQADRALLASLVAKAGLDRLTKAEKARVILHLLLDSFAYKRAGKSKSSAVIVTPDTKKRQQNENKRETDDQDVVFILPTQLKPIGEEALSYLRAGKHVLLAGPPGTGKTLVAQFVAAAWNKGSSQLDLELRSNEFPVTTVANSAWAPFHTIGGILPNGEGKFVPQKGIFISQDSDQNGTWKLYGGAIVLDEMNRADLDRCIGELYPLLSGSVRRVAPAGIPGVKFIEQSRDFRIIATVNDSTLADVVFPMSDGLLRRFQRIDILGATLAQLQELLSFGLSPDRQARYDAACEALVGFVDFCKSKRWTVQDELGDHLPFGIGYFLLLRDWVDDSLKMPAQFAEKPLVAQARIILRTSLYSALKNREAADALSGVLAEAA